MAPAPRGSQGRRPAEERQEGLLGRAVRLPTRPPRQNRQPLPVEANASQAGHPCACQEVVSQCRQVVDPGQQPTELGCVLPALR